MNKICSIISHKGKEIVYFNFAAMNGSDPKTFAEAILSTSGFLAERGPGQLTLSNVKDIVESPEVVKAFKEISALNKPFRKKAAVIGLSNTKRIVLNAINWFSKSSLKPFETLEEAKDYLVSNEN